MDIKLPDIKELPRYAPIDIASVVSNDPGIYIWWSCNPLQPVYIGVALNRIGLLGRVVRQHLCPTYLEFRPDRIRPSSMIADYKGRQAAEKSVFRKKISNKYSIKPGVECVEFISNNYLISLIPVADAEPTYIRKIERSLIEMYNPEYNTHFAETGNVTK